MNNDASGRSNCARHDVNSRSQRAAWLWRAATALLLSGVSQTCFAQSATPGATVVLEPVLVEGAREQAAATLQQRLDALPGGVATVPRDDFDSTGNLTVSRALQGVPGVVVQDFFGGNDQPRIQIRGSGLQQNPVERGILMLQNGLPLNRADGSYIVGFADPRQAESIEVYRGYMANRLGATVLGGALNFISPTGSSQPGSQLTVTGGSFGQGAVAGQTGFQKGNVDGLLQFDLSRRDGFRDYNESKRASVGGNVGVAISDNVTTRFFAGYTDLGFDVAGPLTKAGLEANPRQVHPGPTVLPPIPPGTSINPGPNVLRDQPRRDARQYLAGSRTTATFGAHIVDVALGYTYTDDTFRFPITSGIRTTQGGDFTGLLRYAYKPNATSLLPLFETSAQYTVGAADRENYINQGGRAGAKFGDSRLNATTLSLFAGFNVPLMERFTLSPSISYAYATRDNSDRFLGTRPWIQYNGVNPTVLAASGNNVPAQDTSYTRSYGAWSPSLALSYRPDAAQTLFAAVSHSFEPPTHDDLLATVNGTPNSSAGRGCLPNSNPCALALLPAFTTPDLKAQTAVTVEGGWRGRTHRFSWDVVTYYSWVDNELLSLRDATGASLGAINADKTRHFGVELGVGVQITDQVSSRLVYNFQDFRFHDDPVRGNNRLAGAPSHLITAMLQYQPVVDWRLQGVVRWSPDKTPVDNLNTLYADPYVLVDLRTEYRIDKTFTVFGEITNLFDKTYASSTLIVDQARPDQAAFLPGDGRAFYAGIKAKF